MIGGFTFLPRFEQRLLFNAALAIQFEQRLRQLRTNRGSHTKRKIRRPGKNGGYPNFASDVSCVPGCRGDSVARHSSFKTWSRLGVGDRLRGSHLDQDQVSLSSQPPVFPGLSFRLRQVPEPFFIALHILLESAVELSSIKAIRPETIVRLQPIDCFFESINIPQKVSNSFVTLRVHDTIYGISN